MIPAVDLYTANILASQWQGISEIADNVCNRINKSLQNIIQLIAKLDDTLIKLNNDVELLSLTTLPIKNYSETESTKNLAFDISAGYAENMYSDEQNGYDSNSSLPVIEGIHNMAADANAIIQLLGDASPKVKNLKAALDILGYTADGIVDGAKLLSGPAAGITAAEGIATAGEAMTGVAGIVEAAGMLGPEAAIAALGVIAIGSVVASDVPGSVNVPFEIREMADSQDMKRYLWNKERQQDREKLIVLHHVTNLEQLDNVEKELDSDYMLEDRAKRVQSGLNNTTVDFSYLTNKWLKPEPIDPQKFLADIGLPYLPPKPEITDVQRIALEVKNIKEQALFDSFGKQVDTAKMNKAIAEVYKKYRPPYTELNPRKDTAYRLPTEDEIEELQRDKLGLAMPPGSKNPHKRQIRGYQHDYMGRPLSQTMGRVVNIQLNKPMIENIIINANGTKEGINDLKREVEQALLEILNSAGAAH